MASNQTTLSNFPIKTVIDPNDRFIIYSPSANGDYAIAANNLIDPYQASANGFVSLAGGIILNWGHVSVNNSVSASVVFSRPYKTSAFTIMTVANTSGLNLTGATVIGNTVSNTNYYYTSIGI